MAKEKLGAAMTEQTAQKLNKIAKENPVKPENGKTENAPMNEAPRFKRVLTVVDALKAYPQNTHIIELVSLLKSNRAISRYTSLGILNYLYQKGICTKNAQGKIGYVRFNWTKFRVNNNGLCTEYRYTEPFFINCLIASFTSFANSAQKIIGVFCSKELDAPFTEDPEVIKTAVSFVEDADEAGTIGEETED